ncbi:envelope-like protein, partial [Trifolium medium]|nr:envelope-like protein [Trifolium medium]
EEFEHVTASGNEKSQDMMMTVNEEEVYDEHGDVNSQSGGSKKIVSADVEESISVDKSVAADVVNVDDIQSEEVSVERIPGPIITKRLRSRSGKVVPSASEPTKTIKPTKKTSLKHVLYGPKKTWSKGVSSTETKKKNLKRKEAPSSDSEYDVEPYVPTTSASSRKSIGGKKVPLNVPTAPIDNISFHSEDHVSQWKCVYSRRLALERELGKEALECQEIVDLIKEAGLLKTVWG